MESPELLVMFTMLGRQSLNWSRHDVVVQVYMIATWQASNFGTDAARTQAN